MLILALGLVLFLGVHSFKMIGLREPLAARFGEMGFKGLYAALSLAGFALIIWGKVEAHPSEILWYPPVATRHLALLIVPIAFIILFSAYTGGHIARAVRNPMTLAVALWSAAHLLANGEASALLLFGAFLLWSVLLFITAWGRGPVELKRPVIGDLIAIVAGLGAAGAVVHFHMYLFGVAVLG